MNTQSRRRKASGSFCLSSRILARGERSVFELAIHDSRLTGLPFHAFESVSHKLRVTSHGPLLSAAWLLGFSGSRVTSYASRVSGSMLSAVQRSCLCLVFPGHESQVTCHESQVTSHESQVTRHESRSMFPAALRSLSRTARPTPASGGISARMMSAPDLSSSRKAEKRPPA